MTTNYTNTITCSTVHALCVNMATKSLVNVDITLPVALTVDEAEKPVRKALSNRKDVAFAMVTGVEVQDFLCTLPIDIYTRHAVKLSARGEQGRTREPVMTRTLEASTVHALCVNVTTKSLVNVDITLPVALTVDEAEKPVRKALSNRKDVAFAMVTGVEVTSAVYEMLVARYLELCEKHGSIEAKGNPLTEAEILARRESRKRNNGENA